MIFGKHKYRHSLNYIWLLLATLLLFSFQEVPTKQQLMREEVDRKLVDFRKKQTAKCRQKILTRAGELVDSTLIARAKQNAREIVPKPEIPLRPGRPEVKLPKDTTPIVPILPEEEKVLEDDTSEQEY